MADITAFLRENRVGPITPPAPSEQLPADTFVVQSFTTGYTAGRLLALFALVAEQDGAYQWDYRQTAVFLLQHAVQDTPYQLDAARFDELIDSINCFYNEEREPDPDRYRAFCKNCLWMNHAFVDIFHREFPHIMADLREITDIIEAAEAQLQQLRAQGETDLYYQIKKQAYIIERYRGYRDEISYFIAHELGSFVAERARDMPAAHTLDSIYQHYPYAYNSFWERWLHDPRRPHTVLAKFSHLALSETREVEALYQEDPAAYRGLVETYITEDDIPAEIARVVAGHHTLIRRRPAILEALKAYRDQQWYSFISTVVPQIEGLFYDFCQFCGIPVKNDTLFFTVEKIVKSRSLLGYQYFLYELPVLRNRVAHGAVLEAGQLADISHGLMLDLFAVVSKFTNEYLPQNEAVELIEQADPEYAHTVLRVVKALGKNSFLFEVLNGAQAEFTAHYQLQAQIDKLKAFVNSAVFSDLVKQAVSESDSLKALDEWKRFSQQCKNQCFFAHPCLAEWRACIGRKAKELQNAQ